MNELQIFNNSDFGDIRTVEIDGKPHFVGRDVAVALGYADTVNAIKQHCRGVVKHHLTDTLGRPQEMNIIPEGDVYRLIVNSKLPNAERFERWVFDEVLPSIRKHGAYMTPETLEAAILNPDTMIRILTQLKDEQERNKVLQLNNSRLTVDNQIMLPKAEYFDELVDRNLLTNFRDTAKQLGIRQTDFIDFLMVHRYLYRDKAGKLLPYAEKNNGLFEIKEFVNEKTGFASTQTLITPKGRETFRLLCIKTA